MICLQTCRCMSMRRTAGYKTLYICLRSFNWKIRSNRCLKPSPETGCVSLTSQRASGLGRESTRVLRDGNRSICGRHFYKGEKEHVRGETPWELSVYMVKGFIGSVSDDLWGLTVFLWEPTNTLMLFVPRQKWLWALSHEARAKGSRRN